MSEFNPQTCRILKAEITRTDRNSRDISSLITEIHISQSLSSVSWKGVLGVLDNVGMLDLFGLRGEEQLSLELICDDLGTVRNLDCQIYRIDNVMASSDGSGVTYMIHFLSRTTWEASIRKVIKPFTNVTCSFAAESLMKEYFGGFADQRNVTLNEDKEILPFDGRKYTLKRSNRGVYLQPSVGNIKAIIPNYSPQRAMSFLASRAYSTDSISSSYRFFETLSSYWFVTDEFLMKRATDNPSQIQQMTYGPFTTREGDQPIAQIASLNSFVDTVRVDSGTDLMSGGYKNKSIEINLLQRIVKETVHDYTENGNYTSSSGTKRKISDDIHTEDYMKATFTEENAPRFLIFRDYRYEDEPEGNLRPDQHYAQSYANRLSHNHHMGATTVKAEISGRLDIEPGNVLNVDIQERTVREEINQDQKLSGNYLVLSTDHDIMGNTLNTSITMVKYG